MIRVSVSALKKITRENSNGLLRIARKKKDLHAEVKRFGMFIVLQQVKKYLNNHINILCMINYIQNGILLACTDE